MHVFHSLSPNLMICRPESTHRWDILHCQNLKTGPWITWCMPYQGYMAFYHKMWCYMDSYRFTYQFPAITQFDWFYRKGLNARKYTVRKYHSHHIVGAGIMMDVAIMNNPEYILVIYVALVVTEPKIMPPAKGGGHTQLSMWWCLWCGMVNLRSSNFQN